MSFVFNPISIHTFHQQIIDDKFNRYNSWQYCFEVFKNINQDEDYLALHLAFYLASWGMYRGSSGLLQKDYKIHIGAVQIIKKYNHLRCTQGQEIFQSKSNEIIELVKELKVYFQKIEFINSKNETKTISPTDTLISKIILGTLGCSPAFDRYFVDGVKEHNFNFTNLNQRSFELLFEFTDRYSKELIIFQKELFNAQEIYYPIFKLVDMYFWQEGLKCSTFFKP